MGDIATLWDPANSRGDWTITGGASILTLGTEDGLPLADETGAALIDIIFGPTADLGAGDDLATAVLISCFTDAQADADDKLPPGASDRRGWWADPAMGSKIWLLRRSRLDAAVVVAARRYLQTALQWILDDGVAARVDVVTEAVGLAMLAAKVTLHMSDGTQRPLAFAWAWQEV